MTPRRTVEIDDEAADAFLIAMLLDAAVRQYRPERRRVPRTIAADPPDTTLVEAIMWVLRYYCGADQYAEIEAMIEGLSPPDDKPTLSPSDDAAVERVARAMAAWEYERRTRDWEDVDDYDREAARVAITAYREEML